MRQDLLRLPAWTDRPLARSEVGAAVATLSVSDRELLQLVAWEGLTPAQLAVALGLPGPTVRGRLRRAKERLHRAMVVSREEPTGHDVTDEQPLAPRPGRGRT